MDSLLIWSSKPKRQLNRLPWLQCAAFNWDFHYTWQLAEVLSWNQCLRCHWAILEGYGKGCVGQAVDSWCWAEGRGCFGLTTKGEEIRVCGHHSKAAQRNTADITEFDMSLPYLTTKQGCGKLQKKDLTYTDTHKLIKRQHYIDMWMGVCVYILQLNMYVYVCACHIGL